MNDKKDIVNQCFKCGSKTNSCNTLLKLKDKNYYCFSCISRNKKVYELLKVNSYWKNYIDKKFSKGYIMIRYFKNQKSLSIRLEKAVKYVFEKNGISCILNHNDGIDLFLISYLSFIEVKSNKTFLLEKGSNIFL